MTPVRRYVAAGGVVTHDGHVLVLRRPDRDEVRLPKGHVDEGESATEAALREVWEEAGLRRVSVLRDLGTQTVEYDDGGRRVVRRERYFLMDAQDKNPDGPGEAQFELLWTSWDEAIALLTFEPEREWVRRARNALGDGTRTG